MTETICKNCTYYFPIENGKGECRFNPPMVYPVPALSAEGKHFMNGISYFPTVAETAYCGKFSPMESIKH